MAILKNKDIENMAEKEIDSKIADLRKELIKVKIGNKNNKLRPKEIKKAIARLLTKKNSLKVNKKEVEK